MKETVLTSARVAYEPPYADIIEVAVEGGFSNSTEVVYDNTNGTESLGRDDVADSWY